MTLLTEFFGSYSSCNSSSSLYHTQEPFKLEVEISNHLNMNELIWISSQTGKTKKTSPKEKWVNLAQSAILVHIISQILKYF